MSMFDPKYWQDYIKGTFTAIFQLDHQRADSQI